MFVADVTENNIKSLIEVVKQELEKGVSKFTILLSSLGGKVFWGLTAYNFLKGIPAKIDTYNIGSVDSAALMLYCAGKNRYSVWHARFLLHGTRFNLPKDTELDEKQLDETIRTLKMDNENIVGIVAETTGRPEETVKKDLYEGIVLNPEKAVKVGLVSEIRRGAIFQKGAKVITVPGSSSGVF